MKAYGMNKRDICRSDVCHDPCCVGNKYRLIRGKSRTHRKHALQSVKSAYRMNAKIALQREME